MEGLTRPLVIALLAAFLAWLVVATVAVVGRVGFDRRERLTREHRVPSGGRARRRLLRRAASHRTGRGKWRRISALATLVRAGDLQARRLLERALVDGDRDIVGSAVGLLGEVGDDWAARELVQAMRKGSHSRSRIATQLDRLTPRVGTKLAPLLRDADPVVRFWGATLLARCPGVAPARLVALTRDVDANVRAAAVEAIGERGETAAVLAVRERLADDIWFVRVHACRAAGRLGGLDSAPDIAPGLRDSQWWVRAACKDALRALGPNVAGVLIPYLEDDDPFARNGAAEVLQDIGFVDALSRRGAESELLERIFVAGGAGLREAALRRFADSPAADEQALGGVAS